jgi:hypothetical protein
MALVVISAGVMEISKIVLKPRSRSWASIKARCSKAWLSCMLTIATGQGGGWQRGALTALVIAPSINACDPCVTPIREMKT